MSHCLKNASSALKSVRFELTALCESTEEIDEDTEFNRGRRYEAKGIRRTMFDAIREMIKTLDAEGSWQPIEDAPKGVPVLAYDPTWYPVPYPMILNKHGKWVHWFNELGPFYPTRWMPLPIPPEETS